MEPPGAVVVRRGAPDDAPAVWPLVEQLAATYRPRADGFARTWAELVAERSACAFVAQDESADGRLLGVVVAHVHTALNAGGPVVWVEEIVVDERARRRGAGTALVRAVEAWATGHGARHVALATRRAGPFYRALGYAESATYWRRRVDEETT